MSVLSDDFSVDCTVTVRGKGAALVETFSDSGHYDEIEVNVGRGWDPVLPAVSVWWGFTGRQAGSNFSLSEVGGWVAMGDLGTVTSSGNFGCLSNDGELGIVAMGDGAFRLVGEISMLSGELSVVGVTVFCLSLAFSVGGITMWVGLAPAEHDKLKNL